MPYELTVIIYDLHQSLEIGPNCNQGLTNRYTKRSTETFHSFNYIIIYDHHLYSYFHLIGRDGDKIVCTGFKVTWPCEKTPSL